MHACTHPRVLLLDSRDHPGADVGHMELDVGWQYAMQLTGLEGSELNTGYPSEYAVNFPDQ